MCDVHEISHKTFWPGVLVPNGNGKKGMKESSGHKFRRNLNWFSLVKFARSQEKPAILIGKLSMRVFLDEAMEKRFK